MNIIQWVIDPKNRSLIALIALGIFIALFFKQCNEINDLNEQNRLKDQEAKRISNNHLADLDTIRQYYDKLGILTAEKRALELNKDEIMGEFNDKILNIENMLKKKNPTAIIENNYYVTEKISGVESKSTPLDSMGSGVVTFLSDTVFSIGNSRKISGMIPYNISMYNKKDTLLVNYFSQPYIVKLHTNSSSLEFNQEMTLYTGINRDKKTGELSVWAKTDYPGVKFNTLKGANVKDDYNTKIALQEARKTWGFGFSFGLGEYYNVKNASLGLGYFMGVGLNYSPKKLQFGK